MKADEVPSLGATASGHLEEVEKRRKRASVAGRGGPNGRRKGSMVALLNGVLNVVLHLLQSRSPKSRSGVGGLLPICAPRA